MNKINNKNKIKNDYLKSGTTLIKNNLKNLIIIFAIIFLIFLSFQGYSFYKINKINNLSISYFASKNFDDEQIQYSELIRISNEKGIYSILSKLELIKNNISKGDFDISIELYDDILSAKNLDKNYISLVAINGAYKFIDIVINNKNKKYISNINKFISLIDESLDNYIGNKSELLYLVSILSLNNDADYKNNQEILALYEKLMNNEKISSTIKERVKKIHEFYFFI